MKSRYAVGTWAVAGVVALLMASGCAKPPVEEKATAQSAMDASRAAKANVYAAQSMNEAERIWNDAEASMAQKNYSAAKQAYVEAKSAFEKAAQEAANGKQAMIEANQALLTALNGSWKELQTLATKETKKMAKAIKQSWEADAKIMQESLKTAVDATVNPEEIQAKLNETKNLLDKWMGTLKK